MRLEERITYEPVGVVAHVSAWNYPYFVGLNSIVPALLVGNAGVLQAVGARDADRAPASSI